MRRRDGHRLPERCWIADRTTWAKRSISVWIAATGMSVCACGAAHRCLGWYDGKPLAPRSPPPRVGIFFPARERLTFDVPAGLADPHVIPPHDQHDAESCENRSLPGRGGPALRSHPGRHQQGEQRSSSFRTINPNGKAPAIVDTEGLDGLWLSFSFGSAERSSMRTKQPASLRSSNTVRS